MTAFAFTELFGGAVYQIDDLDPTSIAMIGGAQGTVTVAAMTGRQIAQAHPGASWVRFGTHGSGVGQFNRPAATAFLGSGHLLVLDAGNGRLLGDLNIVGHGMLDDDAHPSGPDPEWTELFGKPGAPLFTQLVDRWGRDQCPGGTSGRTDPGYTADAVYEPFRQRLDYVFTSAASKLAVQHVRIDRALADPHGALPYLSDHQPLRAEFNRVTPNCTPAKAFGIPDVIDFVQTSSLANGEVRWYRFDVAGTYDIGFFYDGAETVYDIYLGDDFSTPQAPYRNIIDPDLGTRFVLPATFFVKVHLADRWGDCSYRLRTHRHVGRTFSDAIVLIPEVPHHEHFPAQPFNIDTTLTCQIETSGWGADDIALEIRADGDLIVDIPNSVIGDFEDDSVRVVGDKIPEEINPYIDGVAVTVIEEDDIDDNDVGVGTIPPIADIQDGPGHPFTVLHRSIDGSIAGTLTIGVDDGRYAFTCRVSKWHPSA